MEDKEVIDNIINSALQNLKNDNKIFVSEKDFQVELAYEIQNQTKELDVKLEYCPKGIEIDYKEKFDKKGNPKKTPMYIDILIIYKNKWYPIELKYKTKKIRDKIANSDGYKNEKDEDELIDLKEQGAQDQGRCNFLWDISRLEKLKEQKRDKFGKGYAIFITNDSSYEKGVDDNKFLADRDFRLNNREILSNNELRWKEGTKDGTIGSCPRVITFSDNHTIQWDYYINISDNYTNNKFRILKVEVI